MPFIACRLECFQAILPKLTRGVTEWNPRTDTVAIHTWIHPWLPLLGSRLAGGLKV
ncbi:unnamed protein product [Ectocarpus sp. 13 AM-2016]